MTRCERTVILLPNILWRQLHVKHGGVDVSVSHQMLQGGQGNAGSHHICAERVPKPMRVCGGNPAAPTVVTE